jgi:hypothetical protein
MDNTNQLNNKILEAALRYRMFGFSVIPVGRDKKPLVEWKRYQTERATADQIKAWWKQYPEANVGIVTGKEFGIVVVDVESGGRIDDLPPTVISKTGGGGFHYYYKHSGDIVKNGVRIGNKDDKRDIRGDGGYVVAPPSIHASGNLYEWLVSPDNTPFAEFPSCIIKPEGPPGTPAKTGEHNWEQKLNGVSEGERNNVAAEIAGKLLAHIPTSEWENLAWSLLRAWNEKNVPPLPITELRSVFNSIAQRQTQSGKEIFLRSDAKITQPEFTSLEDLLNEPDEEIAWIVEGLLPSGGFSLMVAKPKVGKSTLARQLALAVIRGEPFLGRQTIKGAVLYIALEEKRGEVRKHFRLMGAVGTKELGVYVGSTPEGAYEWLKKEIELKKPLLVIVDTLFRFTHVADLNDYAKVNAALDPLLTLARTYSAHLMALHHARKSAGDGADTTLGSTAIFGTVDTLINLKRTDARRTIDTIQRYGVDMETTVLNFDMETKMAFLGGTKEEDDIMNIAEAVLEFLNSQDEPVTEKVIDDDVEGKTTLKRKALRDLFAKGEIVRIGGGKRGDPYLYSCSLVPTIYKEQEKQDSDIVKNPDNTDENTRSQNIVPLGDDNEPLPPL